MLRDLVSLVTCRTHARFSTSTFNSRSPPRLSPTFFPGMFHLCTLPDSLTLEKISPVYLNARSDRVIHFEIVNKVYRNSEKPYHASALFEKKYWSHVYLVEEHCLHTCLLSIAWVHRSLLRSLQYTCLRRLSVTLDTTFQPIFLLHPGHPPFPVRWRRSFRFV